MSPATDDTACRIYNWQCQLLRIIKSTMTRQSLSLNVSAELIATQMHRSQNRLCINTGIISLELPIFIHGGAHFGPLQLYQSLSALVWSVLTLALSLLENAPSWLHAAPISKQPAGLWLQYLM